MSTEGKSYGVGADYFDSLPDEEKEEFRNSDIKYYPIYVKGYFGELVPLRLGNSAEYFNILNDDIFCEKCKKKMDAKTPIVCERYVLHTIFSVKFIISLIFVYIFILNIIILVKIIDKNIWLSIVV